MAEPSMVYWAMVDDDGRIETVLRRPENLFDAAWYYWAEKRWVDDDGLAARQILEGEVDQIITAEQAAAAIAAGPRVVAATPGS